MSFVCKECGAPATQVTMTVTTGNHFYCDHHAKGSSVVFDPLGLIVETVPYISAEEVVDSFGDRMKLYEGLGNPRFIPKLPVMARLDGRGFHSFTKHAKRPFSEHLHEMMVKTTTMLVEESVADVGYTQSDEITLVWIENPFFDGNPQKMCSTLAALASAFFNRLERDPKHGLVFPQPYSIVTFDCRVWTVPTLVEAANVFLWRQQDAARNSIQMAARAYMSHKECDGLNGSQLQEKLFAEHGINWGNYPVSFKRGTFVKHAKTTRGFTAEEIEALPEKHNARKDPSLVVERRILKTCDIDLRTFEDLWARESALFNDTEEDP